MLKSITSIEDLIQCLGIRRTLKGYQLLPNAIRLTLSDENYFFRLMHLYRDVARIAGTNADCVEHNLRTAIESCWYHGNREFLLSISPYPLIKCPSNGQFLEIMVFYCQKAELK